MGRRTSAFSGALDELDALDDLPRPAPRTEFVQPPAPATSLPATRAVSKSTITTVPAATTPKAPKARPAAASQATAADATSAPRIGGTRATQVRLSPELASWLSAEAHRSGRTFASVVALAARAQQAALPLEPADLADSGLDVSRRTATASVAITLRLNGAQRELLDDLAVEHATTRSAIVVAALRASRDDPKAQVLST